MTDTDDTIGLQYSSIFAARCCASAACAIMRRVSVCVCVCLSVCVTVRVCLSPSYILSKRINVSSNFFHRRVATPLTGASNAGGVGRNRDSEPISGFTACC